VSATTVGPPTVAFVDGADVAVARRFELRTRRDRRRAARHAYVENLLPTFALLVAFDVAVVLNRFLVARIFSLAFLLLVPGVLLVATCRARPANGAVRLALVVAASVAFLMVAAVASSALLPRFGVAQPLARGPMVVLVNEVLGLLTLIVARAREPIASLLEDRVPNGRQLVVALALGALPFAAAGAAEAVNHGQGPMPAIAVLVIGGLLLVGLLFASARVPQWVLLAGLYAVAVSVIYSYSLAGDRLFGWDIQEEFRAFSLTMQAGSWTAAVHGDPYRAMLSITALPTVLARVTGISGVSILRAVDPLLFAFFPLMVYSVAVRWVSRTAAFAAAAFVVVQLAFAQQMPAITRQEVALLFFGVLVAVAFDDDLPVMYRRCVVLLAGCALAVTHYSTAYVTALALVGTWLVYAFVRLLRRRARDRTVRHRRVLASWVVLGILAFTIFWNFGVTHSTGNVLQFAKQASERGPEFLPSSQGRSLLLRWLQGNAPQKISGEKYAERVALIYRAGAPWLNGYPDAITNAYPVKNATVPPLIGFSPAAGALDASLLIVVSQGVVALTALGMVAFGWQRRRDRGTSGRELACLGFVILAFVGVMRVSGVAAEAYNQERAQIHAAVVLSVGLATVVAWALSKARKLTLLAVAGGLMVVFLSSSGLAAVLGGGDAPANLMNRGDSEERFAITDAEVATAQWLAANREPDSIVYTDRYGKLRLWVSTSIGGNSIIDSLTPKTLDRGAYVYASEANVRGGRGRGAIGPDYAVYAFPTKFLDAEKATVYSTGLTRVYR
jgi:uncharacterized membrane protein